MSILISYCHDYFTDTHGTLQCCLVHYNIQLLLYTKGRQKQPGQREVDGAEQSPIIMGFYFDDDLTI